MSKTLSKITSRRKTAKPARTNDEITVEVTQAQYDAKRARGLDDDEVLHPGKHKFVRGGFLKRHPELDPQNPNRKQRITIWLDTDIIEHFKQQSAQRNAPAYQTQINQALRTIVDAAVPQLKEASQPVTLEPAVIKAIATEIASQLTRKPNRKAA